MDDRPRSHLRASAHVPGKAPVIGAGQGWEMPRSGSAGRERNGCCRAASFTMDHMGAWPELTPEQYAVIVTACDQAFMSDVMDEFRARQQWAETGRTDVASDLDNAAKQAMTPHFA